MDKNKDTAYTAMDDLTPKRGARDPDKKERPVGDAYPAADAPEGQGGGSTGTTVPEEPSSESPLNPDGSNA